MTEIIVKKFHPQHLEVMDIRQRERDGILGVKDAYARAEKLANLPPPCDSGTFIHDGRIIMCAGFIYIWEGVLDGWIIPSIYVEKTPILFAKTIKTYIESLARTFKAHRFQTTSFDDEFHERWMAWLGFQKEGTLRQLTIDKQNQCIYGRLFQWQ